MLRAMPGGLFEALKVALSTCYSHRPVHDGAAVALGRGA